MRLRVRVLVSGCSANSGPRGAQKFLAGLAKMFFPDEYYSVVGEIPVAAVYEASNASAAPIGNFQKHRAVALARILGADGDEIRRELDFAVFQVHRVAEIDDALVVRIAHRQREVNSPGDALVGACVPEGLAAKNIVAGGDIDANHARVERHSSQGKNRKEGSYAETQSHAGKHSTRAPRRWCGDSRPRLSARQSRAAGTPREQQ